MKKTLIIIIFLITFINATINEHKTDLFFANGIANKRTDALGAWKKTFDKLLEKYPKIKWKIQNYVIDCNEVLKKCTKEPIKENPHLAYNQTINHISDVLEALIQKLDLGEIKRTDIDNFFNKLPYELVQKYHKEFLNNLNDVNGTLELTDKERKIIKDDLIFGSELEEIEEIMNIIENHDLTIQINGYKKLIENGHKVVVLSHSQGNLFTEKVFSYFRDTNNSEWYLKYFEAYGVASPSNSILGNTFTKEEQKYSQDFYLTSNYDAIKYVPFNLNPNTTINEYEKGYTILEGLVKGHLIMTYLNENYLSNIILQNLQNRVEKRNETQWKKDDTNISNCEIQTFQNKYTNEIIETMDYSKNNTSGYLISNANGIYVNSLRKGFNSINVDTNTDFKKIPDPKPNTFCQYLEFAHEFIGEDINDTRPIYLKIFQEETYFEKLTISFNKIDKINNYTFTYMDIEGNFQSEEIKITDLDLFIEDNNHKAKFSKIFNIIGEYTNIKISRNDTNESSNTIDFIATSSQINDSLELTETNDGEVIISWDRENSIEKVMIYIIDGDLKKIVETVNNNNEWTYTPKSKIQKITIKKINQIVETSISDEILLASPEASVNYNGNPIGYLKEDRYDKNKDYILVKYFTHSYYYKNMKKIDLIIDGVVYKTIEKEDMTDSISYIDYYTNNLVDNNHTIEIVPYNKFNEKGKSSIIYHVPMKLLTLYPKVGKPAGGFIEDRYYSNKDELTFSWYSGSSRYPDINKLEILINGSIFKTIYRDEMIGGYYNVEKYIQTGISKNTVQSIELRGYDKYGNLGDTKNASVDMSGIDTTPKIVTIPSKSVYVDYILVPAYVGAYRNAFYVEIYFNGQLHSTLDLDRLEMGSYEEVDIENGTHGNLTVIAYNRYNEASSPYTLYY